MEKRNASLWQTGMLVGALLTLPLLALSYLGNRALGLPFIAFDFFDWLGRTLPGWIVTPGIDAIVAVIRALNLGPTATTAKLAEQLMGVGGILALGAAAGSVFFSLMPRINKRGYYAGIGFGLVAGLLMLAISAAINRPSTLPLALHWLWLLGICIVWGVAHQWVYNDLNSKGKFIKSDGTVMEVEAVDRRQFLVRLGGATATISVIGAGLGSLLGAREQTAPRVNVGNGEIAGDGVRWSSNNDLPNVDASLEPAPGTRPEFSSLEQHYRIDINSVPPIVDGSTWTLPITGLVENPLNLTMAQIQAYEPIDRFITLSCISNPIGGDLISTQRWTGTSLKQILEDARPLENAAYVKITAADGFHEVISLQQVMDDERIMLTYYWDGVPLEVEHGYPLRIYIPDLYGMKQPKWITGLELIEFFEEGYWVRRGWDEVARVNVTSVIDTVAVRDTYEQNGRMFVPIGGIAYAGARGILNVEVRVDNGEWAQARLRTPLSDTTWVIWRYDWAFASGQHTFEVRATNGSNTPQVETPRDVRPSGATGIHRVERTL